MLGVRRSGPIAALIVALAAAGCSSVSGVFDEPPASKPADTAAAPTPAPASSSSSSPSLLSRIGLAPPNTPAPGDDVFKPDDLPCPDVTVRAGAGTLLLGSKSSVGEVNAMDLRYQGTLVRFARECKTAAGVMTMKVGIEGRVITGPAGGPGAVDVPLRLAVVQEGPNPKTVVSKLVHIPVTVGADAGSVDFTHIDPDVAFPLPRPVAGLDNYVVYVGFDPTATAQKKPPARTRKR